MVVKIDSIRCPHCHNETPAKEYFYIEDNDDHLGIINIKRYSYKSAAVKCPYCSRLYTISLPSIHFQTSKLPLVDEAWNNLANLLILKDRRNSGYFADSTLSLISQLKTSIEDYINIRDKYLKQVIKQEIRIKQISRYLSKGYYTGNKWEKRMKALDNMYFYICYRKHDPDLFKGLFPFTKPIDISIIFQKERKKEASRNQ
jgi:hypothetical protein